MPEVIEFFSADAANAGLPDPEKASEALVIFSGPKNAGAAQMFSSQGVEYGFNKVDNTIAGMITIMILITYGPDMELPRTAGRNL